MSEIKKALVGILHGLQHNGPKIGEGFSIPTDKKNHAPRLISGWWEVHVCVWCGELFSDPRYLLVPGLERAEDESTPEEEAA